MARDTKLAFLRCRRRACGSGRPSQMWSQYIPWCACVECSRTRRKGRDSWGFSARGWGKGRGEEALAKAEGACLPGLALLWPMPPSIPFGGGCENDDRQDGLQEHAGENLRRIPHTTRFVLVGKGARDGRVGIDRSSGIRAHVSCGVDQESRGARHWAQRPRACGA